MCKSHVVGSPRTKHPSPETSQLISTVQHQPGAKTLEKGDRIARPESAADFKNHNWKLTESYMVN